MHATGLWLLSSVILCLQLPFYILYIIYYIIIAFVLFIVPCITRLHQKKSYLNQKVRFK